MVTLRKSQEVLMDYSSKGTKKIKDSNNKSKQLDKFYTNPSVVIKVISHLKVIFEENGLDIKDYTFLEPCAGSGSFLDGIEKELPDAKHVSFDIHPEDDRIVKANFLDVKPEYSSTRIAIGNPPFGYKGDLAASFINRSSEWGPIIVFVLPIQFRRYNIQKKVFDNLKLIYSSPNLPKNSFTLEGKPYNVNCLYQIWVDKFSGLMGDLDDMRLLEALPNKHPDFQLFIHNNTVETLKYFDKGKYEWDFAVTRQGFYDYKEKITDPNDLKQHIQYLFIKYKNPISRTIFEKIDFEKLSHVNTSILGFSNTDLVAEYIKIKSQIFPDD